jgi:hypothetical protein
MIQPLRAVHRRTSVALALVLPMILLIGLGARRPRLGPSTHSIEVPDTWNMVRESSTMWQKHPIRSKFYSKSDRPQDIYLVLQTAQTLNEPDLLLYWVINTPEGNVIPAGAQFVGAFTTGKAFLLPLQEERAGHLVLFSRAHRTVFDTARVEKLP